MNAEIICRSETTPMSERRQTVATGTRGASPRYRLISEILADRLVHRVG